MLCNKENKKRPKHQKRKREKDLDSSPQTNHKDTNAEAACTIEPPNCNKRARTDEATEEEDYLISSSKQNWRSRCGRKRKYFGEASARQGATTRERNRFQGMAQAFEALREVIPEAQRSSYRKLSKFSTLKLAITYISVLSEALDSTEKMEQWQSQGDWLNGIASQAAERNDANVSSDSGSSPGMSEDELYTGDFTDLLFADGEKCEEIVDMFNEMAKESVGLAEKEGRDGS